MSTAHYSKTTLADGSRLILAPRHETDAVTLLVLFGVGSRYEQRKYNGISHFLEHLMFKGTKRRPNTLDIAKELDGVGAEYNAFTAKDHTGYYIKVDAKHLPMAIDIMSDILNNSLFVQKEIERERHVIVEEINMYEDNPMMYMDDLFERTLFGSKHPLGWEIAGPRSAVLGISRQHIIAYWKRHYRPRNTAIVIAGKFDQTTITKTISKAFVRPKVKGSGPAYARYTTFPTGPRVEFVKRQTEQVQLALGFPGPSLASSQSYAMILLATIMGGTMSSRLFIKIRERLGLCYFIKMDQSPYQDAGAIVVRAGLARTKIDQAIKAIWAELARVADRGITADELARAKDYVNGKFMLSLEDSENVANWLGRQIILTDKVESVETKLKKFRSVTREQVNAVARKLLVKNKIALSVIGPDGSTEHYLDILKKLP